MFGSSRPRKMSQNPCLRMRSTKTTQGRNMRKSYLPSPPKKHYTTAERAQVVLESIPWALINPWHESAAPRPRLYKPFWNDNLKRLRKETRRIYEKEKSTAPPTVHEDCRKLCRMITSCVKAQKRGIARETRIALHRKLYSY